MKATINGITVEGTPEEIARYVKLQPTTWQRATKIRSDWIRYQNKLDKSILDEMFRRSVNCYESYHSPRAE